MFSLSDIATTGQDNRTVAVHSGTRMGQHCFAEEVSAYAAALKQQPGLHYALFHKESYPFAVLLYSLFHAGKKVWIPTNNQPETANKLLRQGCRLLGQWAGQEFLPYPVSHCSDPLMSLDGEFTQITIFTSGSSGQPKGITKRLLQLQREVEALEQQWGGMLGQAPAIATVSHQHIYGFLFRLLWPLASGRIFHSQTYLNPEGVIGVAQETSAYWVTSPAQLRRMDDLTQWDRISRLNAIFSSGGPLAAAVARQIEERSGRQVWEVYGSSETGGIGWRRTATEELWTPFPGVTIAATSEGRYQLTSPFLPDQRPFTLDDQVEQRTDAQFKLGGRLDRIVKVEEKRVSLDEMEQALQKLAWVEGAYTILLSGRRDRIAAVIALKETGLTYLQQWGRKGMVEQLRTKLKPIFESVVLPRKWLFTESLPVTPSGKIDQALLKQLLSLDARKFPKLLYVQIKENSAILEFKVTPQLIYFNGHFSNQPVLPGVTQLAWVERYGKIVFSIHDRFASMEVIKFKKVIRPGAFVTITLEWKSTKGALYFDLSGTDCKHSSGRMLYGST